MPTKTILRFGLIILSAPFVAFSRVAEAINLWDLKADITRCLQVVDCHMLQPVPMEFIQALVVAEDRRNVLHLGVDPIGIIRAILVYMFRKETQGASTVEQQFVRVVSGSCERTIRRKIREQVLAIAVSRRRSKTQIASAYLSIACYGSGLVGTLGLRDLCGTDLEACPAHKIHEAIARLKYPESLQPSIAWKRKLVLRAEYITCRMPEVKNQARSEIPQPVRPTYPAAYHQILRQEKMSWLQNTESVIFWS